MQIRIRSKLIMPLIAACLVLVPAGWLAVSPAPVAAQEPVTLDLWIFEGEEQLLPALKEAFEAEHPHITLETTLIPEDQYAVKIDTALAAGSPPDIGYLFENRWVKTGKLLPLEETIAAHEIDLGDLNQAVMQGRCVVEGQVYCLGSYTGAVVLIYNKAMFDAAGLDYPAATEPMTIDEYAALAAQLGNTDPDLTKRVWGANSNAPYWWLRPQAMFSDDGRQVAGFVNDEATKHTFEVLAGMVAQGHAPSESIMQSLGTEAAGDLFLQQKMAMTLGGFAEIKRLEAAGIDYGVATLPVEQVGDPTYLPVWTDGLSVFRDSDHPAEALELIAFLATEGQRLRVEVTGDPPLSASAAEEFGWAEQGNTEGREQFLQVIGQAGPALFVPGFWDVMGPLNDAFNLMAEGEATSDALDEVVPRMQESLDENWQHWEQLGS